MVRAPHTIFLSALLTTPPPHKPLSLSLSPRLPTRKNARFPRGVVVHAKLLVDICFPLSLCLPPMNSMILQQSLRPAYKIRLDGV